MKFEIKQMKVVTKIIIIKIVRKRDKQKHKETPRVPSHWSTPHACNAWNWTGLHLADRSSSASCLAQQLVLHVEPWDSDVGLGILTARLRIWQWNLKLPFHVKQILAVSAKKNLIGAS